MNTIVLYGMRGTGKSAIGNKLADLFGYNFIDLDKHISEKNNSKLSYFIEKNGWSKFRDEENKCLKQILCSSHLGKGIIGEFKKGRIISLGGGTIISENNREELFKDKNTKIIYLNTSLENISTRISKDEKYGNIRNSLTGKNILEELSEVFEARKNIYKNNCDFEVSNNGNIEDTISDIKTKLNYGGICIPVIDIENIDHLYNDIKTNRKIEFIELRLDLIFKEIDFLVLEKIINNSPKKIICTNRTKFEGGKFIGTCEESLKILKKSLEFGADYIDIELESLEKINIDKIEKSKVIISHHNFNETPKIEELKNILEKMKIYSPKIYKIAVTPNNIEDVENILKLNKYFKVEFNNFPIIQFHKGDEQKKYYKNIFVSMGELGKITRIDLPKYGNFLTFGTYGKNISAPGQINYIDLYENIFIDKEVLFLGGDQISGSLSPFMHNFSSNKLKNNKFIYKLYKIEEYSISDSKNFIKLLESDKKYIGANITMPYKIDIYNYLKDNNGLKNNAKLVGAVNTLFKRNGKIFGTNTDLEGITGPILNKLGTKIKNIESAIILGAGGASRAVISAIINLGINNIYILNRSEKNLEEIKNHFEEYLGQNQKITTKIYNVADGDKFLEINEKSIIINTLPFGFKEDLPKIPITLKQLDKYSHNIELYFEAVYDSEKGDTPIVKKIISSYHDIKICRGIEMLIGQAKTGFELWTNGGEFKSEEIKKILLKNN